MQDFVACVVGLSRSPKEPFSSRPGIGKSCLCFRFAYPGYDRYVDTHPSLLALHEFEDPVINSSHFLYWGSPVKTFPVRGNDLQIRYHLLEHTVFYQDVTSYPFNSLIQPDKVELYVRRIAGSIESAGKHSYFSRDDIIGSDHYKKLQYPSNLTKHLRGFVVVFDVSLSDVELEMQCKRVEPILEHLCKTKKKVVLAATKRDAYKIMSLEKARELQKKFHVPLIETSAKENLNVEEVFRILTRQVLGRKVSSLSDHVQGYDEAARCNLHFRGSAKRFFIAFMRKKCTDFKERLDSIKCIDSYKECAKWIGDFEAGSIFVHHMLGLYNVRVDAYGGVMGDPNLRREFLEDYVESRHDMRHYKTELRRWINRYITQLEKMTPHEQMTLPDTADTTESNTSTRDSDGVIEPYQIFQAVPKATEVEATAVTNIEQQPPSAESEAGSSLDDHDYLNFDPKNPGLFPAVLVPDEEQVCPRPSLQTPHPDLQAPSPAALPPSPATVTPSLVALPPSPGEQSSESSRTTPWSESKDLAGFPPLGVFEAESSLQDVAAMSISPPPVLPKPGNHRKPSLPADDAGNEPVELPSHAIQDTDTPPLPPVLPKPGNRKPVPLTSPDSSLDLSHSPTIRSPRGTAPPPPIRRSSRKPSPEASQKAVEAKNNGIQERALKLELAMKNEKQSEGESDRDSQVSKKSDLDPPAIHSAPATPLGGRRPSRVAPPAPVTRNPQRSPSLTDDTLERKKGIPKPAKRSGDVGRTKRSPSSSGSPSPSLTPSQTPSHSALRGPDSTPDPLALLPPHHATEGEEERPFFRPKLSMIKQRLHERKEILEERKESSAAGSQDGRIANIRKRLAEQKKSVEASETTLPPSTPPPTAISAAPLLPSKPKPLATGDYQESPLLPARTTAMLELGPAVKPRNISTRKENYSNVTLDKDGQSYEPISFSQTPAAVPATAPVTAPEGAPAIVPGIPVPVTAPTTLPAKGPATAEKPQKKAETDKAAAKKSTKVSLFGRSPKRSSQKPLQKSPKKKGRTPSPEKQPMTRAQFINMSVRPLPALPSHQMRPDALPEHSESDYEVFSLGAMDDTYINYPQLPLKDDTPPVARSSSSVRRWNSFGSNDTHTSNRPQIKNTQPPSAPPSDIPKYIDGYVNAKNFPSPTKTKKEAVGIDRRPLPRIPHDKEKDVKKHDDAKDLDNDGDDEVTENLEYDYPDLRGAGMFRSVPATKQWMHRLRQNPRMREESLPDSIASLYGGAQSRLSALKNENESAGLIRTDSNVSSDYVPMSGGNGDADYVNTRDVSGDYVNDPQGTLWLPSRAQQQRRTSEPTLATTTQQQPSPSREQDDVVDDVSVYMNLPTPERKAGTPLSPHVASATLPREKPANWQQPDKRQPGGGTTKKMAKAWSEDSNVPPAVLPKPQRSANESPSTEISAVETEVDPSTGWLSFEQDYQNLDCSQSLPASMLALLSPGRLNTQRLHADAAAVGKLPPRNIKRENHAQKN